MLNAVGDCRPPQPPVFNHFHIIGSSLPSSHCPFCPCSCLSSPRLTKISGWSGGIRTDRNYVKRLASLCVLESVPRVCCRTAKGLQPGLRPATQYHHFSAPPPCYLVSPLLHYASLRGSHALLCSSLPPLPRAVLCDIQRWTLPRARHNLESLVYRVETFW